MALGLASERARRGSQIKCDSWKTERKQKDALRGQAMRRDIREPAVGEVGESAEVRFGSWADVVI